jgi:hypothetical protein
VLQYWTVSVYTDVLQYWTVSVYTDVLQYWTVSNIYTGSTILKSDIMHQNLSMYKSLLSKVTSMRIHIMLAQACFHKEYVITNVNPTARQSV